MGVKNELNGASATRYYRWDGRAYRVHHDGRADLTSDIHLAGSDEVSISASDVMDGAVHVRQDQYERLIKWHNEHGERSSGNN